MLFRNKKAINVLRGFTTEIDNLSTIQDANTWKIKVLSTLHIYLGKESELAIRFNSFNFVKLQQTRKRHEYLGTEYFVNEAIFCNDENKQREAKYLIESIITHIKIHGVKNNHWFTSESNEPLFDRITKWGKSNILIVTILILLMIFGALAGLIGNWHTITDANDKPESLTGNNNTNISGTNNKYNNQTTNNITPAHKEANLTVGSQYTVKWEEDKNSTLITAFIYNSGDNTALNVSAKATILVINQNKEFIENPHPLGSINGVTISGNEYLPIIAKINSKIIKTDIPVYIRIDGNYFDKENKKFIIWYVFDPNLKVWGTSYQPALLEEKYKKSKQH